MFSVTDHLTFRQSFDQFRSSDIRTDGLCQFVWLPELWCVVVVAAVIELVLYDQQSTDLPTDRSSKQASELSDYGSKPSSQPVVDRTLSWQCLLVPLNARVLLLFSSFYLFIFFCKLFSLYWYFFSYGADQPQMFSTNANIFARRM